jgi:hypothetical protein
MAIGTITVLDKSQISGTLNHDEIVFAGDNAYPAGGSPGFQARVRAVLGKGNVTVLDVRTQSGGGKTVYYDRVNDKLQVFTGTSESSGDLSGTAFRIVVVSK